MIDRAAYMFIKMQTNGSGFAKKSLHENYLEENTDISVRFGIRLRLRNEQLKPHLLKITVTA